MNNCRIDGHMKGIEKISMSAGMEEETGSGGLIRSLKARTLPTTWTHGN